MDISLSLSEEVERMQTGKDRRNGIIDLETCLDHFVLPEELSDLVHCASCGTRTRTKKQHTFAKLPRILCLHLKRFDAARNRKIDDFVSFPARGLNMGGFLPQWREVSRVPREEPTCDDPMSGGSSSRTTNNNDTNGISNNNADTTPLVYYDLFGTVNHIGSMSSGHYVSNVKVDDTWYHCNDQHVSRSTEDLVLKSSAYMLFYVRR
jgi:ubiquitin C-terminal hydrolase